MTWLLRMWLGLPPTKQDIAEIEKRFPELFTQGYARPSEHDERKRGVAREILPWFALEIPFRSADSFFAAVERWLRQGHKWKERPQPNDCPLQECPLKTGIMPKQTKQTPVTLKDKAHRDDDDVAILHLIALGGHKMSALNAFVDVVQKTHSGASTVEKIWVTDPYLFADWYSDDTGTAYDHLLTYLRTLKLTQDSAFRLYCTGSPRSPSTNRARLEESLTKNFPKVTIEPIGGELHFHDRFFIVKHKGDDYRGVIGPSLNSLHSQDIVAISQIEKGQAFDKLIRLLDV